MWRDLARRSLVGATEQAGAGGERAGVRLALLAAFDPHRVADDDVAAFGAMTADERISAWTTISIQPAPGFAVAGV